MRTLRRAGLRARPRAAGGLERDLGQAPARSGAGEWERVRMHPYLTERMLHQSEALAPLGAIAVQHRERLDGSGYPRGLPGAAIARPAQDPRRRRRLPGHARAAPAPARRSRPARRRPSCAPRSRPARLDAEAVEAVLGAAGHRVPRRRGGPAGLTRGRSRSCRLLARGLSNKEIAAALVISPKTVANHIEHIYAKIDASTRAQASLFAMTHGLLPEEAKWGKRPMPARWPGRSLVPHQSRGSGKCRSSRRRRSRPTTTVRCWTGTPRSTATRSTSPRFTRTSTRRR